MPLAVRLGLRQLRRAGLLGCWPVSRARGSERSDSFNGLHNRPVRRPLSLTYILATTTVGSALVFTFAPWPWIAPTFVPLLFAVVFVLGALSVTFVVIPGRAETDRDRAGAGMTDRQTQPQVETNLGPDEPLLVMAQDLHNAIGTMGVALAVMVAHAEDRTAVKRAWAIATHQIGQLTRLLDDLLTQAGVTGGLSGTAVGAPISEGRSYTRGGCACTPGIHREQAATLQAQNRGEPSRVEASPCSELSPTFELAQPEFSHHLSALTIGPHAQVAPHASPLVVARGSRDLLEDLTPIAAGLGGVSVIEDRRRDPSVLPRPATVAPTTTRGASTFRTRRASSGAPRAVPGLVSRPVVEGTGGGSHTGANKRTALSAASSVVAVNARADRCPATGPDCCPVEGPACGREHPDQRE